MKHGYHEKGEQKSEVSAFFFRVGRGATEFARENGFPFVESRDLVTDEAVKELDNFKKFNTTIKELFSGKP